MAFYLLTLLVESFEGQFNEKVLQLVTETTCANALLKHLKIKVHMGSPQDFLFQRFSRHFGDDLLQLIRKLRARLRVYKSPD